MIQKFGKQAEHPDFIRDLQLSLLQQGEMHYADDLRRAVTIIRTAMDASPSYYHVSALPNRVRIVEESLLTRAWHTLEAPDGHYFLTSDSPVATYELRDGQVFPGSGFGNKNTAVLLPIGPKYLFVASPHHFNWRMVVTPTGVRNMNRLAVQFSHRNVYANINSEEIRQLVDVEIDIVVFGKMRSCHQ